MTNEELESLLDDLEFDRAERTRSRDDGKPMFSLKPADGALGAHTHAVADAYMDFKRVATKIAANAGLKARL